MKIKTNDKIIEFIKKQRQVRAGDIINYLGITKQAVFRHLTKLAEQGKIYKIGKPPKVFYAILETTDNKDKHKIADKIKKIIEPNFLTITPAGEIKKGWIGFVAWCHQRNQNIKQSALDYVSIIKKYNAIRKSGLRDGMNKMRDTFSDVYLDCLFYLDFYAIPHFGKTKLGQLLLYAKQSQDKKMIKELSCEIRPKVMALIKKYRIEAAGFIPPTVKREVQLIKELERNLDINLPKIKIVKIKTQVIVPQKTLNKLNDRVENASQTFVIEEIPAAKNILLIDDAVGSGATFNEIAKKIKLYKGFRGKLVGLAITGSLKGFDVISEV